MHVMVAHYLPGRIRLILKDLIGHPERCRAAHAALAGLPGVSAVRVNSHAGSLLLTFAPSRLSLPDLLAHLQGEGNRAPATREAAATQDRHFVRVRSAVPQAAHRVPNPAEAHGLTDREAQIRLRQVGPNILPMPPALPFWRRFVRQFADLSTVILLTGSLLAAFTGRPAEALTVGAITALTAVAGALRSGRQDNAVAALQSLTAPHAVAVRGGHAREIPTAELVPGDRVELRAGDRVPADLVLVHSHELEVDDEHLFGIDRGSPHQIKSDRFLPAGTEVLKGRASGVVIATGGDTVLGRVANRLGQTLPMPSAVERRAARLARDLLKIALISFGVVTVAGLIFGRPATQLVESILSVTAAAVPEGLPTFITLALAAGARRLSRRGVFVRDLAAAEGIGRVDVICTDKTGTLTRQEMTVRTIYAGGSWWTVTGTGMDLEGQFLKNGLPVTPLSDPDLAQFLKAAIRCNNAVLEEDSDGNLHVTGSQTEGALLVMAMKAGLPLDPVQEPRMDEEAFDPAARRMSATVERRGARVTCSKGAPEVILPMCTRMIAGGDVRPMTEDDRTAALKAVETLAVGGNRVIALSYTYGDNPDQEYIFAGLAGISDPPRRELRPGILRLAKHGIRTVMLTGDHPDTAAAVARELGLLMGKLEVVTGNQLARLTDAQLDRIVERVGVFARVTPDQKARIIRSFQRRGRVVAYLGDGMDDAPAVRTADIGVAPKDRGTDVTREAARIILVEDRFEALVRAVEQGRTTAVNTSDISRFLLTVNMAELLAMLAAAAFGLPLPLLPLQLLWLNLIGNSPAAVALGERHAPPGEALVAPRQPIRALNRDLFTHALEMGLASFGLFATTLVSGGTLPVARTMALTVLGVGQILYLFRCRTGLGTPCGLRLPSEPTVGLAAGVAGVLLLATIYLPPLARALGTAPLTMTQWLAVGGAALAGNLSSVAGYSLTHPVSPVPA